MIDRGPGWGAEPYPAIYEQASHLAQHLREEARAASDRAWKLDAALRTVRHASTDAQKAAAVTGLAAAYRHAKQTVHRYDQSDDEAYPFLSTMPREDEDVAR